MIKGLGIGQNRNDHIHMDLILPSDQPDDDSSKNGRRHPAYAQDALG